MLPPHKTIADNSGILSLKRAHLIAILLWVLVWVIPWGRMSTNQFNIYFAFLVDLIRLAIALGLFIVPGALLYILIDRDEQHINNFLELMAVGFAFSIFMISCVGLVGRLIGLPFSVVKYIFVVFGGIELILLALSNPPVLEFKITFWKIPKSWFNNPPLILALAIVILFTLNDGLFFWDDATYGAYITNWQFSGQLGFRNLIHRFDVVEISRFWLAMYPMGQALLSDLSGVPSLLLLSNYLEPILTPMAVLVLYWFLRRLGVSQRVAGFALLIQFSLYVWMVGEEWPVGKWFFESLSEDKVATVFFLTPVFIIMELQLIQNSNWKNRVLFILSGLAIVLTHPVMLFFSCSIAGAIAFLAWMVKNVSFRRLLEVGIICIFLMAPYATIRLLDKTGNTAGPYEGIQASSTYQIERYANILGDHFYGLNPQVLMFTDMSTGNRVSLLNQIFRMIPLFIIVFGAIISIIRVKQGPLYWYVLSSSLVIFIATLPYTGWILGYIVSVRMLSRVSWFAPYGLASILVIQVLMSWFKSRSVAPAPQLLNQERRVMMLGLMFSLLFVGPIFVYSLTQRLPKYFHHLEHNRQVAELGVYIDKNTKTYTTIIATDYIDLQMLPTASAHADLISFREEIEYNGFNNFLPIDIVRERIIASSTIRSLVFSKKKCSSLRKYDIQYILVPSKEEWAYMNTLQNCDTSYEAIRHTKDFVLLKRLE